MHWLLDPFQTEFMQRALVATVIVGILAPCVGTWVVLRKISNLGDALGHGSLAGVASAYALGVSVLAGALVAGIAMAALLSLLLHGRGVGADAVVSVVGTALFAVGVIVASRQRTGVELTHFLFGRILTVTRADLVTNVVLCLVALATLRLLATDLRLSTFDRLQAIQVGVRVSVIDTVLLILVATVVVVSLRTVGTIMSIAMLVTPAAAARLVARNVRSMMGIGIAIAQFSGVAGLVVAYHVDVAPGAVIALTATAAFVVVYVATTPRRRHRRHAV